MKIAMIIALLHPFLILVGTALAAASPQLTAATLANPGFHGFSEMLYEYTSSAANNGSGFEGLGDNTIWWNISTGFVLILDRFFYHRPFGHRWITRRKEIYSRKQRYT